MSDFQSQQIIKQRPPKKGNGDFVYAMPRAWIEQQTEPAMIYQFICNRQLFGYVYSRLQSEYFYDMPKGSGVFIFPLVITKIIFPDAIRPGDIDLLVIPYHENSLVLDRILAIEVKVLRATFQKQGKSPNEYGFSQATSLLALGFPYVAVLHLITSDKSPHEAWQKTHFTRILDGSGRVDVLREIKTDLLPENLMRRAYGRMLKNSPLMEIGLAVAYLSALDKQNQIWMPSGKSALRNALRKSKTKQAVAEYFHSHYLQALDTPRY